MIHFLRQDEACHWYLIPEEMIEEYGDLHDNILVANPLTNDAEDLIDKFDKKFGDYRISNPYEIPINK